MPTKSCLEPRCPYTATYRGRCSLHAKGRERTISRAGKRIYNTKRWEMTRRAKLRLSPLCEWDGCTEIATDVHHVHPLGQGGDPWSIDGLESLCHSHHSMLTRREQMA